MNFRPRKYYTDYKPPAVKVAEPIKVYFREQGKLAAVEVGKAFDFEDAIKFTKEAITGDVNSKQSFLVSVQGGKNA